MVDSKAFGPLLFAALCGARMAKAFSKCHERGDSRFSSSIRRCVFAREEARAFIFSRRQSDGCLSHDLSLTDYGGCVGDGDICTGVPEELRCRYHEGL